MWKQHRLCLFLCLAVLPAVWAVEASAQAVTRIGDYNNWSAYRTSEDGNPVCFIASVPLRSEGDYTRRGNVFSIVTLRPAEDRDPEVSFIAGYTHQEGSAVEVDIDGDHSFRLFTRDDAAWLPDEDGADQRMIEVMIRGLEMVVRGTSSRGTLTTDTYSLRGFTSAYNAMREACRG